MVQLLLALLFFFVVTPIYAAPSIYWGSWIDGDVYGTSGDAPWDTTTWDTFEQHTGKKVSLIHFGQPAPWVQNFAPAPLNQAVARGAIPFMDMNTDNTSLVDIKNGDYDSSISTWAIAVKNWNKPFFLRWNWEMNGSWFGWGSQAQAHPENYVAAWQHFHDVVITQGATQVTWVWCPNIEFANSTPLNSLYPGDNYVDWTCMDGYNWGTNPLKPDSWKSFSQLFQPTYNRILQIAPTKPIMIGETASTEIGGGKASWMMDALTTQIPQNFPQIKAVVWFNWNINENGGRWDWPIESSTTTQAAFAQAIANPIYATNTFSALPSGKIQPLTGIEPTVDADANSDGVVNSLDYAVWLQFNGQTVHIGKSAGDFNFDTNVDSLDRTILFNRYAR